ncbi:MAG TPA: hypothetical protein VNS32_16155, partial [Flavisolibacter sp.]|nr:hypothetical protein [Flavisolibacter sp.]
MILIDHSLLTIDQLNSTKTDTDSMISKDDARKIIASLVERFEEQKELYTGSGYNVTIVRRDFICPFFKALGWDMDN